MKYTQVSYERKVSDGNYGTQGYTVGAVCEEGDDVNAVLIEITNRVHAHLGLKPVVSLSEAPRVAKEATKKSEDKPEEVPPMPPVIEEEKPAKTKKTTATKKKVVEEPKVEEKAPKNIVPYNRELTMHKKAFVDIVVEALTDGKAIKEMSAEFRTKIKEVSEQMEKDEVPMFGDGELLKESFVEVLKSHFEDADV